MQPMRRGASFLLASGLVLLPSVAHGHTDLASSDPADGSTVADAPDGVVLTFEAEVDEAAGFTVFDPDGREVGSGGLDLEIADRNILRGDVDVAAAGVYTIAWSVTGDDGHDVTGEVTFTYAPAAAASAPDTALPASDGVPARVLGTLLIVLAVAMPLRRALTRRA